MPKIGLISAGKRSFGGGDPYMHPRSSVVDRTLHDLKLFEINEHAVSCFKDKVDPEIKTTKKTLFNTFNSGDISLTFHSNSTMDLQTEAQGEVSELACGEVGAALRLVDYEDSASEGESDSSVSDLNEGD